MAQDQQHDEHDGAGLWRTALLAAVVAAGMVLSVTGVWRTVAGVPLTVMVAVIGALPLLTEAVTGLLHLRLSADLAVCVAAAAAIAIGQGFVAAEVVLIMLIGGGLEAFAVGRTRSAIRALVSLAPRRATRRAADGSCEAVDIDAVRPGDVVVVGPGERVPVDGTVAAGHSTVNRSVLTGESLPLETGPGDRALAGSLNGTGVLDVVTERVGPDTAFGRMVHLVAEAESRRAPVERLADRYASYFLPVVLVCAAGTYLWSRDLVRAVAVLVIACPCALVLATPTAIAAGIGRLARRGILVKGGSALEALGRAKAILLDKTGTLTCGRLAVAEVGPAPGLAPADLLGLAAAAEAASEHPVGKAICAQAARAGLTPAPARDAVASPGGGIAATVGDRRVHVGTVAFLATAGVTVPDEARQAAERLAEGGCTVVFAGAAAAFLGWIAVRDRVRPRAAERVAELRRCGFQAVCMLTGDSAGAARAVAHEVGIDDVRSGLLPEDKTRVVQEFARQRGPAVMVGDGVNDAAALAVADVGIAFMDIGTDVAVEAADMVVFGDDQLDKLPEAVGVARRVIRTIRQNIAVFALGMNSLGILAAAMGWLGPVAAAVFHQFSSLFVVGNSLRLLVGAGEVGGWVRGRVARGWAAAVAWRWRLAWAGAAAYLLSGVFVVRPGEVGIVRLCGRVLQPPAEPGLHVRLPWPLTRLTPVARERVERLEIGFRTYRGTGAVPPPAYEWNLQHRGGRYEKVAEEAVVTCGDLGFLDVNAVVHYRVCDPVRSLFRARESGRLLQAAAESAVRDVVAATPLVDLLTSRRSPVEAAVCTRLATVLQRYEIGLEVLGVSLQDVHPPLEVVDAFRRVVDGLEQKEAVINRARAYANEQLPMARGTAAAMRAGAEAEATALRERSTGEAGRFACLAAGRGPSGQRSEVTDWHLYADAMEAALASVRLTVLTPGLPGATGVTLVSPAALRGGVVPVVAPSGREEAVPGAVGGASPGP